MAAPVAALFNPNRNASNAAGSLASNILQTMRMELSIDSSETTIYSQTQLTSSEAEVISDQIKRSLPTSFKDLGSFFCIINESKIQQIFACREFSARA